MSTDILMLRHLIQAAILHNGKLQTNADYSAAADRVSDMLYRGGHLAAAPAGGAEPVAYEWFDQAGAHYLSLKEPADCDVALQVKPLYAAPALTSPQPVALDDEYAAAVSDLAKSQDMSEMAVVRAAIRLYQAERHGTATVAFKREMSMLDDAAPTAQPQPAAWQPIETAPMDGYMLVHEDEAIRALFRYKGEWQKIGYPAIIMQPWGDAAVGDDAKRLLPPNCTLEIRDGCCENPTHWMPLPEIPSQPTLLNGLTEQETAASASVAGLSGAQPACQACGDTATRYVPEEATELPGPYCAECGPGAAQPEAPAEPIHVGACITDGRLHVTIMQRKGHVVHVLAAAEMDASSLHERDGLAIAAPAAKQPAELTDARDAARYRHTLRCDHEDAQWVDSFDEFKAQRDARIDAAIKAQGGSQ